MAQGDDLRRSMQRLGRSIEERVRRAAGDRRGNTINVARRRNVVVTANVGEDGAVQGASSGQYAPIYQDGKQAGDKEEST
jgi:hypothetical protein